jgi:hypothetical protein
MRIPFTGYSFVRELVTAGHEVVAALRGDGAYEGLRGERVQMVRELCETRFGCARAHVIDAEQLGWSEARVWDEFVACYAPRRIASAGAPFTPGRHEL